MSENRTNTCDRCGDEYDSYHVFIRDNITDILGHVRHKDKNYCKPCRMVVTDYGAYLTQREREEIEPKYEV